MSIYPCEVLVVTGVLEVEFVLVFLGEPCQHAVEDVVVSLLWVLVDYPGLLQQVLVHLGAFYCPVLVEEDVDVFSKPRRVVIPHSFCIAKG